jgi:hypothetical protein
MKDTYRNYSLGVFILMSLFVAALCPAVVILLSGNLHWLEGWFFVLWFDVMMLTNMIYMYVKNPTLFSERLTAHGSISSSIHVPLGRIVADLYAARCPTVWAFSTLPDGNQDRWRSFTDSIPVSSDWGFGYQSVSFDGGAVSGRS